MKRGEVWLINLDPTLGAEIKKIRPAVIVSNNDLGKLPLRVIVPITDWKSQYAIAEWMVELVPDTINKLSKVSAADCFQVRSVSTQRLIRKIGVVSFEDIARIELSLSKVLCTK
jgi:mRNA interferase MazF